MATASNPQTATRILPRLDSLQARLIAAAAVWTLLGLIVGGFLLSGAFRASVLNTFDARLRFDLDGMIAAAEPDASGNVNLQGRFNDPRFERVYSGWYWQIVPEHDPAHVQISRSLFDRTIKVTETRRVTGGVSWGWGTGPEDKPLRFVSQHIEFPVAATRNPADTRGYDFVIASKTEDLDAEVSRFNGILIWSFTVLGLGLVAAIFVQVRIGLLPLRRVSEALARIRDGKARRLDGRFPAEIEPLASELNSLIEHSAEVVGRARTHVSNLAHFLKTPLTVLSSEAAANPGPLADAVMRQVMTMRRQVDHYLVRARAAGALDVLGNRTPVKPVLDDLARVLMRIHADRGITIDVDCPSGLSFRGERQDLEEMAGNLIDNACKWAHGRVSVLTTRDGAKFTLIVGDDGEGLDEEERTHIGQRGERLDESVPGSGLGLAIVRDIAKLYGGELVLGESKLGGFEARVTLPAIA
ncbi:MAG TPA: sensor histidine kinase [Rhizomicrobium sp.]